MLSPNASGGGFDSRRLHSSGPQVLRNLGPFVFPGEGSTDARARFGTPATGFAADSLGATRVGLSRQGVAGARCAGPERVLEAVDVVERTPEHWRQMGRALARLHGVKGERFGFETHAYWGSLFQDNTPLEGWVDFFRERRLVPRLRAAIASGHLPPDVAAHVERLGDRLPELCGPPVVPALLHGDAHQNNFLSTPAGPVLLDPAVYYGHPELELAYIDFFAPVPEEFFHGYRELAPVDPGFAERRELWRIPAWLAMVEVDGAQHQDALTKALRAYE
ncbi:fructosamine kinase family protein [Vitiosangium sp. GDMCC 1.1324]|uniref:fructosamine kinase family protein n=1 Tax=Vitiosangium sp. (strain GDMCC 1.1324) TaxID=2138576 RepID=UPI000D3912F1|nr:fructosamine kinase family protein [Vitiosangium sp. GDMCC 1.1324]PTL80088.1 hypothetical protein DAT35_29080 [Vitiosangium sp. GDMCC 1.1324]